MSFWYCRLYSVQVKVSDRSNACRCWCSVHVGVGAVCMCWWWRWSRLQSDCLFCLPTVLSSAVKKKKKKLPKRLYNSQSPSFFLQNELLCCWWGWERSQLRYFLALRSKHKAMNFILWRTTKLNRPRPAWGYYSHPLFYSLNLTKPAYNSCSFFPWFTYFHDLLTVYSLKKYNTKCG